MTVKATTFRSFKQATEHRNRARSYYVHSYIVYNGGKWIVVKKQIEKGGRI